MAADVAMFGQRVLDGRRGRKQPKRKCVDFNTPLLRHLISSEVPAYWAAAAKTKGE